MLKNAEKKYDFFETPKYHSKKIYNDCKPRQVLKVIDICCGLGSLTKPWYDNGHDITMIEINKDFIPYLQTNFPRATIIHDNFFALKTLKYFDIYLCNPPFNTTETKKIYIDFFCKILQLMSHPAVLYFICPKMFYKIQSEIKIEVPLSSTIELCDYIKQYHTMPACFYFDKFNSIDLHSNGFRFDQAKIKRMIVAGVIQEGFIDEDNFIVPYYEFRYFGNAFDFTETKCHCGIFKVNC